MQRPVQPFRAIARYVKSLRFEAKINPVELATLISAILGAVLLLRQMRQTERAIGLAAEANQIARAAQVASEGAANEQRRLNDVQIATATQLAAAAADSATSAKTSAAAAQAQAMAATAANALAAAQQRGRLTVSVSVDREPSEGDLALHFAMPILNAGLTEARKVRFATRSAWLEPGNLLDVYKQDWSQSKWTSADVVSPGERERVFRSILPATKEQLDAYNAGRQVAGLLLRVEYCDVFGSKHHITRCAIRSKAMGGNGVNYCGSVDDEDTPPLLNCSTR